MLIPTLVLLVAATTMAELDRGPTYYGSGPRTATHDILSNDTCLTQNLDNSVLQAGSVACQTGGVTTDNAYMRVYDLDTDHSLVAFTVAEVQYGVETAVGNVPVTVNIYAIPNGTDIPNDGLPEPICSVDFIQADGELFFDSVVVPGCPSVNGLQNDLGVEVRAADCIETGACTSFFIGSNTQGQIRDGWIQAEDCGIVNPVTLQTLGFVQMDIVIDVCGATEVPAAGPIGVAVLILILGGASGLMLRRSLSGTSGNSPA